jgi:parallel beta-helix repeat protein
MNINDHGTGSLRQAIIDANANPNGPTPDVIDFNISPGGVQGITPQSALPEITDPVVIDGTSQPGFAGTPIIQLDGSQAGTADGLSISAGGSTVEGLAIGNFSNAGISLASGGNNIIQGNYVGTDVTGTVAMPNGAFGVYVGLGSSGNRIGTDGSNPVAQANVITATGPGANAYNVLIDGTNNNLVTGNYIGTNATGTAALGGGNEVGVGLIHGAQNNFIAGLASPIEAIGGLDPNIISGNSVGIQVDSNANNNLIAGNFLGTDGSGSTAIANVDGIQMNNGSSSNVITNNLISGNTRDGVMIFDGGNNNTVSKNLIAQDQPVVFDDGGMPVGHTYTLTSNSLTRDALTVLSYDSVPSLVVNGDNGGNTFNLLSTAAGMASTINAGTGSDVINVGSAANGTVDPIQGSVTVNGQGVNTTLNVNDQGANSNMGYDLYGNMINLTPVNPSIPPQTINYFNVAYVNVYGNDIGLGVFRVHSTLAGTSAALFGYGTDLAKYQFYVGLLDDIQGPLALHSTGNGFADVEDGGTIGHTYTLTASKLQRDGMADITYDGQKSFSLATGTDSTVNVLSLDVSTDITVRGGDTVTIGQNGTMANILANLLITQNLQLHEQVKQVTLDDSADPSARTITLAMDDPFLLVVSGMANSDPSVGKIMFDLDPSCPVAILGGNGGNTFNVLSTAAGTASTINAGTGSDVINVGSAANGTVDPIQGSVTVNGQGANTTLNVNDQGASSNMGYDLYGNKINLTPVNPSIPPQTINYFNVAYVNVYGNVIGLGVFRVHSTLAGTSTALFGYGDNLATYQFYVGVLDEIQGPVALHGAGNGFADVEDGSTVGHTYTLTAGKLRRDGMADITYDGQKSFSLGICKDSTVNVLSLDVSTDITVRGGDTVTIGQNGTMANILGKLLISQNLQFPEQVKQVTLDDSADPSARTITLAMDDHFLLVVSGLANSDPSVGKIMFDLDPSCPVAILGGNGGNTFAFNDGPNPFLVRPWRPLALRLDGGGSINTLDYSSYFGDILVDLHEGIATGVAGGISHFVNVNGSIGNCLIVGDANNNVIKGGTGRNILIGGLGSDTLIANTFNDNIEIGGTTNWDTNVIFLEAIQAEWDRTDRNFNQRFSDLFSGGNAGELNTVFGIEILLNQSTVHADTSPDTLTGGSGHNWYFVDVDDLITDYSPIGNRKTKVT